MRCLRCYPIRPGLKSLQSKANMRLFVFDWSAHNLIDLAKIRVLACFIVIKGRRPP
jgi:hypothetical protein